MASEPRWYDEWGPEFSGILAVSVVVIWLFAAFIAHLGTTFLVLEGPVAMGMAGIAIAKFLERRFRTRRTWRTTA
jgi:hypothetical protein